MAHGAALASIYRACMKFSWQSAIRQFAKLGRILDISLHQADDEMAAQSSIELFEKFLARIELNYSLKQLGVSEEELSALAKQSMVLPDYTKNPKIPTGAEMLSIIRAILLALCSPVGPTVYGRYAGDYVELPAMLLFARRNARGVILV